MVALGRLLGGMRPVLSLRRDQAFPSVPIAQGRLAIVALRGPFRKCDFVHGDVDRIIFTQAVIPL
jgi:hypothetical protein